MNCKPDRTPLTADDLAGIALDNGLITPKALSDMRANDHYDGFIVSNLVSLTANVRRVMMDQGRLVLDTGVVFRARNGG